MNPEEKEIRRSRLRLLDLLKSFYIDEPDAEKMSRWRGTFAALAKENVNPVFDRGVAESVAYLQANGLEQLQDEYYKLFTDPFTDKGLSTSASFYLDGRTHDKTLIEIRSLLAEAGIERMKGVTETEDNLTVMLDILARLIEEDGVETGRRDRCREELVQKYLVPFGQKFALACQKNEFARFYEACSLILCGFLELERQLMGVEV